MFFLSINMYWRLIFNDNNSKVVMSMSLRRLVRNATVLELTSGKEF